MRNMNHTTNKEQDLNRFLYKKPKQTQSMQKEYEYPVAIILRTKDRPICLARALSSIISQTYKNWQIILVNDGGNPDVLNDTLSFHKQFFNEKLTVINNPTSLGMSQGLNQAIEASSSEFIVVHDDDDSWHPEFLQETVNFLNDPANSDCGGVITLSVQVLEEMTETNIIEREKKDFNSHNHPFTRVSLFRLMMQNTFPPISFLFRRSVVDKIGNFNLDLPVLNDWDFNIRCGYHYEIGVIHKHLANYHLRINQQNSIYGNSIIATQNLCLQYETVIRNSGLRAMLNSESHSQLLGLCLALGGHYLPSLLTPTKIDHLINFQNQFVDRLDKGLRAPLASDLFALQNQLNQIQNKLDMLLHKEEQIEKSKNMIENVV